MRALLRTIVREPLVHFLLIGLIPFIAFGLRSGSPTDSGDEIVVDRADLVTFLQQRSKIFAEDGFTNILDRMSEREKRDLIRSYVRQEVLYRHAKALGLDKEDYVLKRRVIQTMEFLIEDMVSGEVSPTDEDVREYYEAHAGDYVLKPRITLTQVFFKQGADGEQPLNRAKALRSKLRSGDVPAREAAAHGDRFLYGVNFVERDRDYIARIMGDEFAEAVFQSSDRVGQWQGPVRSKFGVHLVRVTGLQAGRQMELSDIWSTVKEDAARALEKERENARIDMLMDRYSVTLSSGLSPGLWREASQ